MRSNQSPSNPTASPRVRRRPTPAGWASLLLVAAVSAAPTTAPITAPTTAPTTAPATLSIDVGHGVRLELVRIPAGRFTMGSPDAEADRDPSEGPAHAVTIGRPFWVGKYEVTQGQWVAAGFANQSQAKDAPDHDRLPCESVSWTDCQKFCDAATKASGRRVRLPTEAEWEYAARAGTTGPFGVGRDAGRLSSTAANFNGTAPYGGAPAGPERGRPTAGGTFPADRFGVCDAVGNVSEWCQDVYHDDYDGAPADGSAWEAGENPAVRVYRGGAFNNDASSCRSAVRFAAERGNVRNATLGFRVVVDRP